MSSDITEEDCEDPYVFWGVYVQTGLGKAKLKQRGQWKMWVYLHFWVKPWGFSRRLWKAYSEIHYTAQGLL